MDRLISWIESYLPGALPKWILGLSMLLSQVLYNLFPDLPKSWLPQTEEQTFLTRLLLSGSILLFGSVSLVILLMKHNRKIYVSFTSQIYSMHNKHKIEISELKKSHTDTMKDALDLLEKYEAKVDKLLQDNRPPGLLSAYNEHISGGWKKLASQPKK